MIRGRGPSYTRAQLRTAKRRYLAGQTLADVAEALGLTTSGGALCAMRRAGLSARPRLKPTPEHGRRVRYTYYACRCEECRRAQRDYQRKYQAGRAA